MKNTLFRFIALFVAVMTLGGMTSCTDSDDTDNKVPTIKIGDVQNALTEITFTLTPQDARSYAYAFCLLEDFKANKFTLIKVDGSEKKTVTMENLTSSTAYVIVAIAYNGAQTSEQKTTRVSTLTEAPSLEILDVTPVDDNVSFKLKASVGATKIKYTVYPFIEDEDPAETDKRKEWNEITEVNPEGNVVKQEKLETGIYVVEAYAIALLVEGATVTDKFKISITSRAYVDALITALDYKDATLSLTKNAKCSKYYIGLTPDSLFKPLTILKSLEEPATAKSYLVTDNYTGSLLKLVQNTFDTQYWGEKARMTLWIVPCDMDGTFSTEPKNMIKGYFAVPKRVYVYGGNATVAAELSDVTETSYKVALTATNCASYHILAGTKTEFANMLEKQIIENKLLKTEPQTAPTQNIPYKHLNPDTDYVYYAIGVDNDGKIGELTKKEIHTVALEFNSAASYTYSFVATPETATVTFVPNAQCTSVRYIYMSNADFIQKFEAKVSVVKSSLALGTAIGYKTLAFTDPASLTLKLKDLESNQLYLFFALAMDNTAKFGTMAEELPIRTPAYDVTGTATAEISDLKVRGSKVTFTVTPSAECKECYVAILDTKLTGQALVKKIIKDKNSTYMYDENAEGFVPALDFDQSVSPITATTAIYVLCSDASGKYNNPEADKQLLKK
ncbi:MAG: hypothetical protein RRZ83_02270 [Alistipes sp.]